MTDEERIHFLNGRLEVLQQAVCALIAYHPYPAELQVLLHEFWEKHKADQLYSTMTPSMEEAFSLGFETGRKQMADIAKIQGRT
jgi:hypothetical protein